MQGIILNENIAYQNASLRFFGDGEHHISRFVTFDILLLVFDGALRFSEDGQEYEVTAGQYFIQKNGCYQKGDLASDAPKYLYVHFTADWSGVGTGVLPRSGEFDPAALDALMRELDFLSHSGATYVEQTAVFFALLSALYRKKENTTLADKIAQYISKEYLNHISLEALSRRFHFSKNHIINIFKAEYGKTPFEYINDLKIKRAEYLLEVTSEPIETVAFNSGFNNYSQFYRLFVQKNNASPAEWRKQKRLHMI